MGKILILNPPFLKGYSRSSRSPAVTKSGTLYYPIYLSYLAGYLEQRKNDVKLLDAVAEDIDFEYITKEINLFNPGFIICDSSVPSGKSDAVFLDRIKQKFPDIFCVLVGVYPTSYHNEISGNEYSFDAFIKQEFEYAVDKIISLKKNTDLKNVYINDLNGNFKNGRNDPEYAVLDDLPYVSAVYKKHLDIKKYFYSAAMHPVITILSSRGCPYKCSFCNMPHTFYMKNYRRRTALNLMDEFNFIKKNIPEVKEIFIEDDSFNADLNYVKTFCAEKIKSGNNIKWSINFNPQNFDEETIRLLKQSNCRLLVIGYESGINSNLDIINKNCTVKKYVELDKIIKKNKLKIHGCFIIGLPYDTNKNILETFKLACKLNLDTVQFFPLMLNRNTPLYELYRTNNWLLSEKSDFYNSDGMHKTNVTLPDFSDFDIMTACAKFRRKFYLRPNYILRKMGSIIFSYNEIKRTLKSFFVFIKYL